MFQKKDFPDSRLRSTVQPFASVCWPKASAEFRTFIPRQDERLEGESPASNLLILGDPESADFRFPFRLYRRFSKAEVEWLNTRAERICSLKHESPCYCVGLILHVLCDERVLGFLLPSQ
ncbi:Hypothetical protein NTJ_00976 [Nesidiocoris tenuis]|uniref:Uncharacterized protein n=1 Tax=Nesidiocoris tenuis TaxID=355587 RepID=A0ABN7ABG1_9HEMI|nr:Hypothetical protein NTJ_00976 [Nesidiocoris tenuis]